MTGLDSALTDFGTAWTQSASMITNSPVLMVFLAGGILILAARVFKRFRKAVR